MKEKEDIIILREELEKQIGRTLAEAIIAVCEFHTALMTFHLDRWVNKKEDEHERSTRIARGKK